MSQEIDTKAELLIEDYNSSLLSKPQAIDVEDFAENYLGLHFHYTDLSHNGFIWGRMVFNDAKIIVYNSSTERPDEEPVDGNTIVIDNRLLDEKMEHAFRSTVMHEVGHAIYHDEYYYIDCHVLKTTEQLKTVIPAIVKCPAQKNKEIIVKIGAEAVASH